VATHSVLASPTKAARAIAAHPQDVTSLIGVALQRTAGVGKSIAAKVDEVNATGSFAELEDLRADIPDGSGSRPGSDARPEAAAASPVVCCDETPVRAGPVGAASGHRRSLVAWAGAASSAAPTASITAPGSPRSARTSGGRR
jgi:hypothetical protein